MPVIDGFIAQQKTAEAVGSGEALRRGLVRLCALQEWLRVS
jgi:hypothetical protein